MSLKTCSLKHLILAAALLACGPDDDAGPAATCPLDQVTRMAAPPRGWQPGFDRWLSLQTFGDHIFYRFDPRTDPTPTYWMIDRCGGEPERFTPATARMTRFTGLETDEGWLLYAQDGDRHVILDRLDVPGFEAPRPVPGLPAGKFIASASALGMYFSSLPEAPNNLTGVAGIGARAYAIYLHHGDPDVPVVQLGVRIVTFQSAGDRLFMLDDDGDLRDVDPGTGASELVLAGVRRFTVSDAARRLIWQQLGDDVSEPIFLRDLDTGEDRQIAVNDFTALSWNRPGDRDTPGTGTWAFAAEGAYAALYGPAHALVAVVRTADGVAIEPPAGVRLRGTLGRGFALSRDHDDETAWLRWDPATDALHEWYRGPVGGSLQLFAVADDSVDYIDIDEGGFSGVLWRADHRTGEATMLIPRVGVSTLVLEDGRYLTALPSRAYSPFDLVVFDPDTGRYTTVAADVDDFRYFPDQGLLYLGGDDGPGLWAAPIPPR
ncbi:hypothetical protein OV090_15060 [Nannocystis sp. RBIL2]|uniref:hypothetical protein n=1 Tax=Nannocystis sp. RBIL2 TaxID=2996788 RepID=UPI00226FD613|nr:hypothetical protein [Nannocystis sp. RBIL2]MCY1066097.1 hypothetical protein [Nannocystis sp. RBIL2]